MVLKRLPLVVLAVIVSISWVSDLSFSDPILLQVPQGEGSILGNGNLRGVDNASFQFNAAADINLEQVITTGSEIKINSNNGNILTGNLRGSETIEINAEGNIATENITADQQIILNSSAGQIATGKFTNYS
jgi:hypothetical protein